jgi:Beta-lactamase enzyme family
MASVSKVAIMVTVMDRAIQQGRDLTDRERGLLEPMITVSDNDAATALWADLGGGETVDSYLASIGLTHIQANPKDYWGASLAPPREVALLLADLGRGQILDEPMRSTAVDLLTRVEPGQRWGVTAGIPDQPPPGTVIGIKDGWYQTAYGWWWVNSAGVIVPSDAHPAYAIAVLTKHQPSFGYGVETIEGIAARIHAALHGADLSGATGGAS